VFIVVSVYFVIDSVRKFLDTLSYICVTEGVGEQGAEENTWTKE